MSNIGVILIVAVTGAVPEFIAVNEGISPFPEATKPIDVLLFVQEYVLVPPEFEEPKTMEATVFPLQTSILVGLVTFAFGLTVIVKVFVEPMQLIPPLLYVGVTVIIAITGEFPLLMAKKELIAPLPDAAKPIEGVSLVQLYVVVPPEFVVPKFTAVIKFPLQTT